MKYLQSKERNNNVFKYILVVLILIPTFLFWRDGINTILSYIANEISIPFFKIENHLSDYFASLMIGLNEKEELLKQNSSLTHRIQISRFIQIENSLLKEENVTLKKILGRANDSNNELTATEKKANKKENNLILAFVLSGPVSPPYDSLIIDIGKEKVVIGSLILNEEGFFMGEVIEVNEATSKVKLLSSYGKKTDVFLGENKTMVSLVGIGSGNFFVSLPKDFSVKENDYAIYPGEGIKIVAVVDSVEYKEGEIFKKVILKSPFNIKNIRMVGIVNKI